MFIDALCECMLSVMYVNVFACEDVSIMWVCGNDLCVMCYMLQYV